MKNQILTIAALLVSANVATAAVTSSQSATTGSFHSVESIMNHIASTSNKSVSISTKTGNKLEDVRKALANEATQELRKGGIIHSAFGSLEAVGEFTVVSVESVVVGATRITKFVFKGAQTLSNVSVTVSEKLAMPVAKGVDATAQVAVDGTKYVAGKTVDGAKYVGRQTVKGASYVGHKALNVGEGVYLGLSASGRVMYDGVRDASKEALQSHSLTSATVLLGSISMSPQALGSKVVKGFQK